MGFSIIPGNIVNLMRILVSPQKFIGKIGRFFDMQPWFGFTSPSRIGQSRIGFVLHFVVHGSQSRHQSLIQSRLNGDCPPRLVQGHGQIT